MNEKNDYLTKNITIANFHNEAKYSTDYKAWWIKSRLYSRRTIDYHCNLNNLLSVVNQIESLGYKVFICRNRCQICKDNPLDQYFINIKRDTKELAIFDSCYEFITKYYVKCIACKSYNIHQFNNGTINNYCKDCSKIWLTK